MSNTVILDPADRKKIRDAIEQAAVCLQEIADKRDDIKEIAKDIKEKYEIAPKQFNKLARSRFKHNHAEVTAENEEYETLYESIVEGRTDGQN